MSLLSRLLGGGRVSSEPRAEPEAYNGFAITPTPIREGSQYRLSALIEKEVDGETKAHILIRADMLESPEAAASAATSKAKQVIDEQGDRLFG